MKFKNIIRIIDNEDVHDILVYFSNRKYYISLKDFRYYLKKSSEHSEIVNYRIEKAIEHIERFYNLDTNYVARKTIEILRGKNE